MQTWITFALLWWQRWWMLWFFKDGEQEKKDDDGSHPNVQQLTQLNWVDNVHWTFVGDDDPNLTIQLQRKDVKQSERITGLRFNPEAIMNAEYEYRTSEMQQLSRCMNRGNFTRHECTTIYHSRWQSRISFYLPLTTFSFSQCERLQGIMYLELLPQMIYLSHPVGSTAWA